MLVNVKSDQEIGNTNEIKWLFTGVFHAHTHTQTLTVHFNRIQCSFFSIWDFSFMQSELNNSNKIYWWKNYLFLGIDELCVQKPLIFFFQKHHEIGVFRIQITHCNINRMKNYVFCQFTLTLLVHWNLYFEHYYIVVNNNHCRMSKRTFNSKQRSFTSFAKFLIISSQIISIHHTVYFVLSLIEYAFHNN